MLAALLVSRWAHELDPYIWLPWDALRSFGHQHSPRQQDRGTNDTPTHNPVRVAQGLTGRRL